MRTVLVLSANRKDFNMRDELLMTFMYNRKIVGPSLLPCDTPQEIYLFSDRTLSILTTCPLLLRYDSN